MKYLAFIVLLTFVSIGHDASAQSITIDPLPGTLFCAGDSLDVSYTAIGAYTSRNSFSVQISDQFGSFDKSFTNIGSKRTTVSGTIRVGIPGLIPSARYRMRMIASEPYFAGTTYPDSLSLGPKPTASAYALGGSFREHFFVGLANTDIAFKNTSQYAVSYVWDFGPDAVPQTSTDFEPIVQFTTTGRKTVKLRAIGAAGCETSWTNSDNPIMIVSCSPSIPPTAFVDSTTGSTDPFNFSSYQEVWLVPGGTMGEYDNKTIYAEAGANVKGAGQKTVVYLKAGASYYGKSTLLSTLVYEDGAGLANVQFEQLVKCDDLEFDYSDAPPYKIQKASVSRVSGSTIQVYPNPTTDRLWVVHADNIIREISIRNTLGAEQLFMHPEGLGKTSIDVSRLAAGLYFLDMMTDQGIETHKIVVR